MNGTVEKSSFFMSRRGRLMTLALFLVFAASVGLDQTSKMHAHKTLLVWEDPQNVDLFRGTLVPIGSVGKAEAAPGEVPFFVNFKLQYSRNRGAAFSMLADLKNEYRVPFFYTVTLLAVVMIGFYLRSTPWHHHFTRFGLVMILSGAIGNFIDRVRLGYVIDFFDFNWNLFGWRHDFAIFNVADVAINIGVIMLIIDMIIHRRESSATAAQKKGEQGVNKASLST